MNEIAPLDSSQYPSAAPFYWHGSSTALLAQTDYRLLPPSVTGLITEPERARTGKNLDQVFFTADRASALIYAMRACRLYGGQPILFRVIPQAPVTCLQSTKGTSVYHAAGAFIEAIPQASYRQWCRRDTIRKAAA